MYPCFSAQINDSPFVVTQFRLLSCLHHNYAGAPRPDRLGGIKINRMVTSGSGSALLNIKGFTDMELKKLHVCTAALLV